MVEYFKKALEPYNGKVYAMNSDLDAPGLWVADGYVRAPLIYDDDYADFLLGYCKTHDIELVVSLFDIELPILSRLKSEFSRHNIRIIVGDEWLTSLANDKWNTYQFLQSNGFPTRQTFISLEHFRDLSKQNKIEYPVYIKPRWGMGSISVYRAYTFEEADYYYWKVKSEVQNTYLIYESAADIENSVLIQERLPGKEYGLDIINDLDGNHCVTVMKEKLAMRAGETDGSIIVENPTLRKLGTELARLSRHPGNMDVDVFFDGVTPYVLELNPRFGGGYPFSHEAGVNLPKALIEWHKDNKVYISELLTPKIGLKIMKGIVMISKRDEK